LKHPRDQRAQGAAVPAGEGAYHFLMSLLFPECCGSRSFSVFYCVWKALKLPFWHCFLFLYYKQDDICWLLTARDKLNVIFLIKCNFLAFVFMLGVTI
jgi:hypothetical protein